MKLHQKEGTKIKTEDPVAITISEDLKTEVQKRRELDELLRGNELLSHDAKVDIDNILGLDNRLWRMEHLINYTNHLINTVHDYCISGEWKIKKEEKYLF